MEKAEMPRYNYDVEAHWAGSDKKPKQIGENFLRMIAFLSKSHSAPSGCRQKFWVVSEINSQYNGAPLRCYTGDFTNYVEHKMAITDGEPDPTGGYLIFAKLAMRPLAVARLGLLNFMLCDGSPFRNEFQFHFGGGPYPPDPTRVTFQFHREALLGGLSIWPSEWAAARCALWGASPAEASGDPIFPLSHYQMPWMCYLSAERAAKVRAPAGIVTERTPDGGLLMIAAETRLDPQDPQHMKRSRALAELLIEHVGEG